MRKLTLTGALVLFGAGTAPQIVFALAVCILWFGLVTNYKPFLADEDDRLGACGPPSSLPTVAQDLTSYPLIPPPANAAAQVEALQILFTLQIGLVLQLQAASEGSEGDAAFNPAALDAMLIMLNVIVILLAVVQQPIVRKVAGKVQDKCRVLKSKCNRKKKEEVEIGGMGAAAKGSEVFQQSNPAHVKIHKAPAEKKKKKKETTTGEEAPEGWTLVFSKEHNTNYYRNIETGTKVWNRPEEAVSEGGGGGEEEQKKKKKKEEEKVHPRGWTAKHSAEHSTAYFVNDHTQETTWDAPSLPAPPPGWKVLPHAEHGEYYIDIASKKTQFHHPHDDAPGPAFSDADPSHVVKIREAPAAKPPRGWSARTDPATGKAYFHNDHTTMMTWDAPALPAPPVGWEVHPHAEHDQYYINVVSKKTQWHHPHDDAPGAAAPSSSSSSDDEDAAAPSSSSSSDDEDDIDAVAHV